MSSIKLSSTVLALISLAVLLGKQGCDCVQILSMNVPEKALAAGSEDIILGCEFTYTEEEKNQLVVKWYFSKHPEPIYQWKASILGQKEGGFIIGYNISRESLSGEIFDMNSFTKRMDLRIKNPVPTMSGTYMCKVSTFVEEDFEQKDLLIYDKFSSQKLPEDGEDHIGASGNHSQPSSTDTKYQDNKREERSECKEKKPNSMHHYAPVGSIIAWVSKPTANAKAVEIPPGWQRCDGSEIHPPSVWAGEYTPDLNHGRRFLRGGPDSDMLAMEEDQMEDHLHVFNDPGHAHGYTDKYSGCSREYGKNGPGTIDKMLWSFDCPHERTSTSSSSGISVGAVTESSRRGDETRPKNMNVIYIMRVW